MFKTQLRVRF